MSWTKWVKETLIDIFKSLLIVAAISGILFAYSGIWPPLVVVESGSMEPNLHRGDVVLIKNVQDRSDLDTFHGSDDVHFGRRGDVIVYGVPGRSTPIIHRTMRWVSEGEPIDGGLSARSPGFVTKGDANSYVDQISGVAPSPVKPEWVRGRAVLRIPAIGYVRLFVGETLHF